MPTSDVFYPDREYPKSENLPSIIEVEQFPFSPCSFSPYQILLKK